MDWHETDMDAWRWRAHGEDRRERLLRLLQPETPLLDMEHKGVGFMLEEGLEPLQ